MDACRQVMIKSWMSAPTLRFEWVNSIQLDSCCGQHLTKDRQHENSTTTRRASICPHFKAKDHMPSRLPLKLSSTTDHSQPPARYLLDTS
eukprot:scaffold1172_cov115-Cylindrotheca_fusiformis.AAC.10